MAGGQAVGGIAGAVGSYLAAKQQREAADRAKGALTKSYDTAVGYQQPWEAQGRIGLNRMAEGDYGVAVPGQYQSAEQQPTYTADQFNFQKDPGYGFAMQEGQNAVLSSAAGKGAGLSGASQKALAKYGTNLANATYGDAYNRYMQGRQQNYNEFAGGLGQYNTNRQFGAGQQQQQYLNQNQQAENAFGRANALAGYGQTAVNNLSSLASNYGSNLAGLYGQQGNAQAAGTMGVAQSIGNIGQGIGGAGMMYGLSQMNQTPGQVAQSAYNATPYGKAANQFLR
jgi:hypothetical protein